MPRERRHDSNSTESSTSCHICANKDTVWWHKHWLQFNGDLAKHLQENGFAEERISPILAWAHTQRATYGGMVDERGVPLSAWEARREQHSQYEKTYAALPEPRTLRGRVIAFRALMHLLTAAHSDHATSWLKMLTDQFSIETITDEAHWSDFQRFVAEYGRSSTDPDNAQFLERVNTRPVIALAGSTP